MNTFRTLALLTITVMATAFMGCAATTIQVPRTKPAEVNLGNVKKVAVASIDGDGGQDFSDKLTQAIMESGKYEVLDRQHLAQISSEQNLAVGEAGAAGLGKVLGAAALVVGRISKSAYEERVSANEGTCYAGGKSGPCTTYTRTGIHHLAVNLKVIDVGSGKILATKTITGDAGAKREEQVLAVKTSDPDAIVRIVPPLDNTDAFKEDAVNQVVAQFMKLIAPYKIMVPVVLYEQDKNPAAKAGVAAAKAGNWSTAIAQFKTALSVAEASPIPEVKAKAHYNLGVALGYSGSYDEGISEIENAVSIHPDEEFQPEIAKIRSFKADEAKLKAQEAQ